MALLKGNFSKTLIKSNKPYFHLTFNVLEREKFMNGRRRKKAAKSAEKVYPIVTTQKDTPQKGCLKTIIRHLAAADKNYVSLHE